MDAGGRLEIRIIDQVDFVVMEFEDDGCGMTQDVQRNLFEPFFTPRRNGGGTGLGLSITDRIVKDHEGTIEVASQGLGHGSLFRVRLPRRATQSEAA
ncbi:MAG: ATP-binding protein [Planctomycetaceae bacterium]